MAADPHENVSPLADDRPDEIVLARLRDVLDSTPSSALRLVTTDGESFAIPAALRHVLSEAADALSRGEAVTLTPLQPDVGTSQAASLLEISHPYLIKLLDDGAIPYQLTGTLRRINLLDLYAYKERRRQRSQHLLQEMTRIAEESDGGYD